MNFSEKIHFLVMDVDGTLTDGKVYIGNQGELFKSFDIKDGYGIKELLPIYNIVPIIITARKSESLNNRCKELGITEIHQGIRNKIDKLNEIISKYSDTENVAYTYKNVAYIGDDILDIQCMKPIRKAGGLVVCPSDAVKEVLDISDFISIHKSGEGAVREFIDWLVNLRIASRNNLRNIKKISNEAYEFIIGFCPSEIVDGRYELNNGVLADVMTYLSKDFSMTRFESHKKYTDIQYIVYGSEIMMSYPTDKLENNISGDYDETNDVVFYNYNYGNIRTLFSGEYIILNPNEAHRGAIFINSPTRLRKIVIKVPFEK